MSGPVFIAYDGSPNSDDAVVLGRALAELTGSELVLAHVFRAAPSKPNADASAIQSRERFLRHRGEQLLERAAQLAGDGARRVVVGSTTTATGMRTLAERENAVAVVFGSASNTEPGRVHPGSASRRLLQGAPSAVAFAPAGYRLHAKGLGGRIGFTHDDEDATARRSAEALASAVGGEASAVQGADPVELLVIGSRPDAETGRVQVSANAEAPLHAALSPVIVVARGVALPVAGALASVA